MTSKSLKDFTLSGGQKAVVWLLGLALVALFISSLTYRMSHPGNKVEFQQQSKGGGMSGGMGEGMSEDAMKNVRALMEQMGKEPDNLEIQLELANSFMMIRAYGRAQTFFEKVVSVEPENVQALMGLGMCYYQAEQFEQAATVFDKIVAIEPDDSMAGFNAAIVKKYYLHKHEDADAQLKQIIANPKTSAEMKKRAEEELKKDAHAE
ncbi:tetratricopeptide repeat protein [Desulfovibrio sp. JC022]|uniref:tetratricopeptide repeat protein n=1 Tax=Desulfovibrio sp. JC022 TaxID=2593642 RepID=UPI0013D78AEC|nr:tetratricopeptide repeat protein [Desulfovibrio sp. JC022]NDV23643.1 tetratricopeptide repeat protein [Desulfovibrio sp. JC022]